jgi:hypothetical protein
VRQRVVFQSRPVSRLRYTQLGVLARPLTRTSPRGGRRVVSVVRFRTKRGTRSCLRSFGW